MAVFIYSVSLFLIGGIIAASFNASVGIVMMVLAAAGLFFSLIQFAESDTAGLSQEELDRRIEDVLHHHPR
jgi:hypothetical protein